MKLARFKIKTARDGSHYWVLVAANGRVLCTGETHTRKRDAVRATQTVRKTLAELERRYG
jgi:uncharacterized protein YegP (UPF0339 family)